MSIVLLTPNPGQIAGPVKTKNSSPPRSVKKDYVKHQTASIVPAIFRNLIAETGRIKEFAAIKEEWEKDPKKYTYNQIWARYCHSIEPILVDLSVKATNEIIQKLTNEFQDHVETKLQLFYTQILLVIKTNKIFALHHTKDQSGQGKDLYPAAHDAAIPSLKYQEGSDWIDLASGTSIGKSWNITTILPKAANDVDLALDGKNGAKNRLRFQALEILNKIAIETNPDTKAAFQLFIGCFLERIEHAKNKSYRKTDEHAQKLFILYYYEKTVRSYQLQALKGDDIFLKMCPKEQGQNSAVLTDRVTKTHQRMWTDLQNDWGLHHSRIIPKANVPVTRSATQKQNKVILNIVPVNQPVIIPQALTKTARIYKVFCETIDAIKKLVIEYFSSKESQSIKNRLQNQVREEIRKKFNLSRSPNNLPLIVEHLLYSGRK